MLPKDSRNRGLEDGAWREIPGYPGYIASESGRILNKRGFDAHMSLKKSGYFTVGVYFNTVQKTEQVHALIARTFIGPRPAGLHINHKDGNKTNNAVANLEYVTHKQNAEHAARLGLYRGWSRKRGAMKSERKRGRKR